MNASQVREIRAFNRFYTGVIGLLNQHVLESRYTLPEVRVLYEVYHHDQITAREITAQLAMDKGYLSRLIKTFERKKMVRRIWSEKDARHAHLSLTAAGRKEFERL